MRVLRAVPVLVLLGASCGDDPIEPPPDDRWEPVPLEEVPFTALGGGRLGFDRLDPDGHGGYYVIDAAAETAFVYPGFGVSPALSADGEWLASSSPASDYNEVWNLYVGAVGDTAFAELRGPIGEADFDDSPVWTSEGDSIVYSVRLWDADAAELRRRAVAGGDITTIVHIPRGEIHTRPSIAREPWLIAMSRPGGAGIFAVYPSSGSTLSLIAMSDVPSDAEFSHDLEAPAWSPDGTAIAFLSHDWRASVNRTELYLYDPAADSLTLLTSVSSGSVVEWGGSRDQRSVAWSPDGSRIAFTAYDAHLQSHVYVIRRDGSELTQVTTRPGIADFAVTWIP